jgi:hypothetical protein
MFCTKCGIALGAGSIFCHTCGAKIAQPVFEPESEPEPEPLPVVPAPMPFPEFQEIVREIVQVPEPTELAEPVPAAEILLPAEEKAQRELTEKNYFGLPALIFCLVIIGLLSISTGIFAWLHFWGG